MQSRKSEKIIRHAAVCCIPMRHPVLLWRGGGVHVWVCVLYGWLVGGGRRTLPLGHPHVKYEQITDCLQPTVVSQALLPVKVDFSFRLNQRDMFIFQGNIHEECFYKALTDNLLCY